MSAGPAIGKRSSLRGCRQLLINPYKSSLQEPGKLKFQRVGGGSKARRPWNMTLGRPNDNVLSQSWTTHILNPSKVKILHLECHELKLLDTVLRETLGYSIVANLDGMSMVLPTFEYCFWVRVPGLEGSYQSHLIRRLVNKYDREKGQSVLGSNGPYLCHSIT